MVTMHDGAGSGSDPPDELLWNIKTVVLKTGLSRPSIYRYMKRGLIWCFQLNRRWVRDAAVGGNIARFINHSCRPNCYVHIVDGTIWIRAARTIWKGEELTYHYNTDGEGLIKCRCRPGCQSFL